MARKPFESSIQDLVYNMDVGIGLRLIKLGLYLLFVLIVMLLYTATQFRGLKQAEAMDYAQLGRNLMQQKQMITQCVRPLSMWYLIEKSRHHDSRINNHPDILHPPLYPTLLAAGFKISRAPFVTEKPVSVFPAEQWVIIPLGHLCTLLTGLVLFLLGYRIFDQRVALLGVTIYFLSNSVWSASISGTGVSLTTLLSSLAFYTAWIAVENRRADKPTSAWAFPLTISLLCCALAFLTRYGAAVIVPVIALFVGLQFRQHRWTIAMVFVLAFLVAVSPWLLRNKLISGGFMGLAPYAVFNSAATPEDEVAERSLTPSWTVGQTVSILQVRWLVNFAKFYSADLRTVGEGLLVCFFLAAFLYRFIRTEVHVFRWCLVLGIFLLMNVAALFGEATMKLMLIFWPLIILFGLAFFFVMLDRLQMRARILNMGVTGLLVFLSTLPLIFALLPPRAGVPYPPYFPPFITHVCKLLNPTELMCSDMPWATAWYGNRNSLLLPENIDQFYTINDYNKRVSGIYFTTITRNKPYVRTLATGTEKTWFPILEGRIPGDFPLNEGFPLNNLDQLFLTDRQRWNEK